MKNAIINRRNILIGTGAFTLTGCRGLQEESAARQTVAEGLGIWSSAPSLPDAVQEIYPCAHKGRLHLAGGFTAKDGRISGPTAAHHIWQPGEASWSVAVPLPTARHHPHLISFKDRLFAIAGFESSASTAFAQGAWTIQNSGWVLREDESGWEDMPALPAPAAEAVVGVTGDDVLHLAGGRTWAAEGQTGGWRDHIDTDHHYVLADINGRWERAAPCLYKRNSTGGAIIGGHLHIVGGREVGGGNLAYHTVYDHKEDRWRRLSPMPQAQGGLAAASLGGQLYAFGGEFFDNGGGVYPQSWVYDALRDVWSAVEDMPNPRHGLGAVELGGAIYVIGGALQASGVDTSAVVDIFKPI